MVLYNYIFLIKNILLELYNFMENLPLLILDI